MAISEFWEHSGSTASTVDQLTDEKVKESEKTLGYKLPHAYIDLLKAQNGGYLAKSVILCDDREIYLSTVLSLSDKGDTAMFGTHGASFWFEEWGYPRIGVPIALTISGGHELLFLDYTECGPDGEPSVTLVDQEVEYSQYKVADTFDELLTMLVTPESLEDSEGDKQKALEFVKTAPLGSALSELCDGFQEIPNVEEKIRNICIAIVEEKGFFALHNDPKSTLVYGIILLIYLVKHNSVSCDEFLEAYPQFLALPTDEYGPLSTLGYAPMFVREWLEKLIDSGDVFIEGNAMKVSNAWRSSLVTEAKSFGSF